MLLQAKRAKAAHDRWSGRHTGALTPSAALCKRLAAAERCTSLPVGDAAAMLLTAEEMAEWSAADQGPRNTCVAFAATACLEILTRRAGNGGWSRFSPQFLYWSMRQHPPGPNPPLGWLTGATKLGQAADVVERDGCCLAGSHRYAGRKPSEGLAGPAPTDAALEEAGARRFRRAVYRDHPDVLEAPGPVATACAIHRELAEHARPVAIAVATLPLDGFTNWPWSAAGDKGLVHAPASEPDDGLPSPDGGHAVCVFGFLPDDDPAYDGGWFVFRNSWGLNYGHFPGRAQRALPPMPGFGVMSARYVNRFCWEWLSLQHA